MVFEFRHVVSHRTHFKVILYKKMTFSFSMTCIYHLTRWGMVVHIRTEQGRTMIRLIMSWCLFRDKQLGELMSLQWRHNGRDGVPNHQPHNCLLNCLFTRRSKKTSKLRVTGLCEGNSPVTGEFPARRASSAENISIWWHHHGWVLSITPSPVRNKFLDFLLKSGAILLSHSAYAS